MAGTPLINKRTGRCYYSRAGKNRNAKPKKFLFFRIKESQPFFGSVRRTFLAVHRLNPARGRCIAKQAFPAPVLVDVRPVDAVAAAGDAPIRSLRLGRV